MCIRDSVHGIERRSRPQAYLRQLERTRKDPLSLLLRKHYPRPIREGTRRQQRALEERSAIEGLSHGDVAGRGTVTKHNWQRCTWTARCGCRSIACLPAPAKLTRNDHVDHARRLCLQILDPPEHPARRRPGDRRQRAGRRQQTPVVEPDAVPGERVRRAARRGPGRVSLAQARQRRRVLLRRERPLPVSYTHLTLPTSDL